ncbi:MAG: cytochrome c-type biogenesis protein CcmH [Gammaproteobacteria bacterium]|nr:cytochrome c-type biogenesis protein CcmH [Gammaproteobacteria bacterium]
MNRKLFRWIVLFLLMAISHALPAQQVVTFENPETKQRYENLLENLRCLVCQNQALSDSNAGLANDLRVEVERMLRQGESDQQVVDFLVDRYGDFVLYDPPLKTSTYLLWFAPLLLLILFSVSMITYFRHQKTIMTEPPLDCKQRARAADLLNDVDQ